MVRQIGSDQAFPYQFTGEIEIIAIENDAAYDVANYRLEIVYSEKKGRNTGGDHIRKNHRA
jgi:hypothetical protein